MRGGWGSDFDGDVTVVAAGAPRTGRLCVHHRMAIRHWHAGCPCTDRRCRACDAALGWAPGRVVVSANGFVFMVLSFEYLSRWGRNWHEKCPSELLRAALRPREVGKGAKHVVVLAIAPDGYDELFHKTVESIGGRKVTCLGDMIRYSRMRGGERAPAVVRLNGGMVVQVGACVIEEGRLDPRGAEEIDTAS